MRNPATSILIVDDDASILESLEMVLSEAHHVVTCATAEDALERLAQRPFSAVLCDINLPGANGETLLAAVKASWPSTEVVMITGDKDVQTAVRCMRLGAYDYIAKPWDVEEMRTVVGRAVEKSGLLNENAVLKQVSLSSKPDILLGSSEAMQNLRDVIAKVAVHDAVVLIQGESGTGKEMVARAIHAQSLRRRERFVAIGCGSVPVDLVESELFGHERGAFSSAYATRVGKFEYASGGTLLLDDVAALPLAVQAKLLRVLQEREICRLGSNRVIPVDVRVLSSTNMDLQALIRRGQFREDLYWRLSGVPLQVPPLRERGNDVVELLQAFLIEVGQRYQKPIPKLTDGVLKAVSTHSFPGNVRELKHLAETLFVLSDGDNIDVSALPVQMILRSEGRPLERLPLKQAVREFERQVIRRTLRTTRGNQSRAADLLGIHRNTLLVKMIELDLPGRHLGDNPYKEPTKKPLA
jgi:DNA-binding NtrC family response regulator